MKQKFSYEQTTHTHTPCQFCSSLVRKQQIITLHYWHPANRGVHQVTQLEKIQKNKRNRDVDL